MNLSTAAQTLIHRIADHAREHRTIPDQQLPALYALVRDGLPPLEDETLDSLFGLYHQAEEAEDAAHLWRATTPFGSEQLEREAANHAQHFFSDVHHALTQAGLTGDPLPHYFLTDALEATA